MRKLHLNVDELEIQSFETTSAPHRPRGTVEAHETFESECVCDTDGCGSGTTGYTCGGCDTPGYTCEDHCTGGPSVAEPIRAIAAFQFNNV
ncbi:MAG TPA: hypothetical protein VFT45_20340 [Longimicrobium sp.]|nr:hypothetical protein [Longimicrobium sp.]